MTTGDGAFKLCRTDGKGCDEEVMRITLENKIVFPENLDLDKALEGIHYMSDKLYSVPDLYKNIQDVEEAKEIMKDLGMKMKEDIDLGGM